MLRQLILQFQGWSGLDTPQLQAVAALTAIVGAIALWGGRVWGWRQGRREMHQFLKGQDGGEHVVIERLIFEKRSERTILFDREIEEGVHRLRDVVGSDELAGVIRAAVKKGRSDGRIFAPGHLHRLMMERIDAYISGNDRAASQAAMFGRSDEYYKDEVAFTARYMVGEDGFVMLHVILVNPKHLVELRSLAVGQSLTPRRQAYKKRYFDLLPILVKEYEVSAKLFREIIDEDQAGETATFWTALLRTRKSSFG